MSKLNKLEKLAVGFTLATALVVSGESQADTLKKEDSSCVVTVVLATSGLSSDTVRQYDFTTDTLVYRSSKGFEGGISATSFSQLTPKALQKAEALRPAGC
jgi:hypothetical protein